QTGNYKDAVRAAESWAAITPNAPAPYKILAQVLADQNDERAEKWFDKAVAVSGGNTGLVLELADFLMKSGKGEAARAHLEKITQATDQENRRKTRLLRAI
ncbi:MAG: tetratricopeptide repeat protein, partial [Octadecabacter sp.]|nr:tetratricopeptide repeat protein [Octadecabacter sp.]